MSTPTTFRTFSADELAQRTATERELALTGIEVSEIDSEHPAANPLATLISVALPYRTAAARYRHHVDSCTACQDSPVWDIECDKGNELAALAADACAAQSLLAVSN